MYYPETSNEKFCCQSKVHCIPPQVHHLRTEYNLSTFRTTRTAPTCGRWPETKARRYGGTTATWATPPWLTTSATWWRIWRFSTASSTQESRTRRARRVSGPKTDVWPLTTSSSLACRASVKTFRQSIAARKRQIWYTYLLKFAYFSLRRHNLWGLSVLNHITVGSDDAISCWRL